MFDAELTWKEAVHRFSMPRWVMSQTWRYVQECSAPFIPTEFNKLFCCVRPITMVSYARLRGLHSGTREVIAKGIPGEFVECGVARGGSAAIVALTLRKLRANRKVWLFDTFEGLPQPSPEYNADFEIADLYTGTCRASTVEVERSLGTLGVGDSVRLIAGLFQETLKSVPIYSIALLHVDGDWYESVKCCLDNLYDRVSPGGIIQFDDYGHWAGARRAIDEFFESRRLKPCFRRLDFAGRQLVKPKDP